MILHPSVRLPLLVLAVLSSLVGATALVGGLLASDANLLWRGAVALVVGVGAFRLSRRPRSSPPAA